MKMSSITYYLRQFRKSKQHKLSASEFLDIWNHFDKNRSGFLELKEINSFLVELVDYLNTEDSSDPLSEEILSELRDALFDAFDNNRDGKISVDEMAEILPPEENFQLIFKRDNCDISTAEFIKAWRQFDLNRSGFIEANEFLEFLRYIIQKKTINKISEEKLKEYSECLFYLLDTNRDGKLEFSEIMSIFPVKETFLSKDIIKAFGKVREQDLKTIFEIYEQPGVEYLTRVELDCLIKDLLVLSRSKSKFEEFKRMLLNGCNFALSEKINIRDLKTYLLNVSAKN